MAATVHAAGPRGNESSRFLLYMKKSEPIHALEEPVGIVISRGSRHEDVPTVAAYVWGPPPEVGEEVRESKVA